MQQKSNTKMLKGENNIELTVSFLHWLPFFCKEPELDFERRFARFPETLLKSARAPSPGVICCIV